MHRPTNGFTVICARLRQKDYLSQSGIKTSKIFLLEKKAFIHELSCYLCEHGIGSWTYMQDEFGHLVIQVEPATVCGFTNAP